MVLDLTTNLRVNGLVIAKTFLHPSPGPLAEIDCDRLTIQQTGHFYDYLEYATAGPETAC